MIKIATPLLEVSDFFFGLFNCSACFAHGLLLDGGVFDEFRKARAEEFLLHAIINFATAAELPVPVGALVVFNPRAGAADFIAGVVQSTARLGHEDDEGGTEALEGVEIGDLGLTRHTQR